MESSSKFLSHADGLGLRELPGLYGLREVAQQGVEKLKRAQAVKIEGLLAVALSADGGKASAKWSKDVVRSQLMDLAGSSIGEDLIQPVLLSKAKELIG